MWTTRDSRPEMAAQLLKFLRLQPPSARLRLIHCSHNPVGNPGFRPGTDPLCESVQLVSGRRSRPTLALALTDHTGSVTEENLAAAAAIGAENVPLPAVLAAVPEFRQRWRMDPDLQPLALPDLMRLYAETVHFGAYLASHDHVLAELFANRPAELSGLCDRIFSTTALKAAAAIEGAIAQYVSRAAQPGTLLIHDDWPPARAVKTLTGDRLRVHVQNCHGVIPHLSSLLTFPPRLREYQLCLFRALITGASVTCLHTKADARRLQAIAEYLAIPERRRAELCVRNMIPSCYLDIDPRQVSRPLPVIEPYLRQGKKLGVVVERLDPIKRDGCLLRALRTLIERDFSQPESRRVCDRFRFIFVAGPIVFPDQWQLAGLYRQYHDRAADGIAEINARYRALTGSSEDFVITPGTNGGELCGLTREELRTGLFPFADIALQTGQEGLCLSVQEPALLGTMLEPPRLVTQVVSSSVGFAEKVRERGLMNAFIVEDPADAEEFAAVLSKAIKLTLALDKPERAVWRDQALQALRRYYADIGSSFYEALLPVLVDRLRRSVLPEPQRLRPIPRRPAAPSRPPGMSQRG